MPGVQPDIAERLQVDRERARRVAEGADRFAARMEEPSLERASAHVLAGRSWSLVNVDDATRAFDAAAEDYARLGRSFSVVLRICAASQAASPPEDEADEGGEAAGELGVEDWLHILLAAHWAMAIGADVQAEPREVFGFLTQDPALPSMPVGRLGIPLRRYLAVSTSFSSMPAALAAVNTPPERRAEAIADGLIGFLERAQEPYAAAMADRYHWRGLQSGLLPVEPELLAVSVLASATARHLSLPRLTQSVGRQLSSLAEAFLLLGEVFMLETWGD